MWDEFTQSEIKLSFLLRLLDRYPLKLQTKGSFVNFTADEIIITTNEDPREWYGGHLLNPPRLIDTLARRVSHVIYMGPDEEPVYNACSLCPNVARE